MYFDLWAERTLGTGYFKNQRAARLEILLLLYKLDLTRARFSLFVDGARCGRRIGFASGTGLNLNSNQCLAGQRMIRAEKSCSMHLR